LAVWFLRLPERSFTEITLYRTYEIGLGPVSNSYASIVTLVAWVKGPARAVASTEASLPRNKKGLREKSRKTNKGETSMTALLLQATPFVEMVAPKLQTVYRRFLHALDAFAEAKMRSAVPEQKLRRAQREINHYRRLMHANHKSAVNAERAGR
jgi:hypothetical protein